ncbi:MAG: TolC family protein, partial [Endomicrobiales bacterium]
MKPGNISITIGLLVLLFSSANTSLFGADQFLDTCLQIAQARDKKLAVAQEQLNLSKVRVTRSGRNFFPSVTLQRKFSRGKTFDFTSVTSTGTNTTEEYQSEEFGLKAMQPIYEGGRQRASYRYDRLMVDSSRYNYTKAREELFFGVKLAYYEMLSLRMEYQALKKAFADIEALLR